MMKDRVGGSFVGGTRASVVFCVCVWTLASFW